MSERAVLAAPVLPIRLFVGWVFLRAALLKLAGGWLDQPKLGTIVETWLREGKPYGLFAPFLRETVVPHAQTVARIVTVSELLVGAALLAGFLTRPAALGSVILSCAYLLARGDGADANPTAPFVVMGLVLLFSHSGRTLGLDAALADRLPRWLT